MNRGFTVVEMIITLVVITVLLSLGVIGIQGALLNARDSERKADVESIARGLESRYDNGNSTVVAFPSGYSNTGVYPGINEIYHAMGCERTTFTPSDTSGYLTDLLKGTTPSTLTAPGKENINPWAGVDNTCDASAYNSIGFICVYSCPTDYNFKNPSSDSRINSAVTKDTYIYAPIADDTGQVCCCGNCRSFYLYYRSEADNQIYYVKSKHQ